MLEQFATRGMAGSNGVTMVGNVKTGPSLLANDSEPPSLRTIMANAEQDCQDLLRITERLYSLSILVAGQALLDKIPPGEPTRQPDDGALNLIAHMQFMNHERIIMIELLVSAIHERLNG